ncbi:MAG: OmpA family protein [Nitrosomonadales bacterium]
MKRPAMTLRRSLVATLAALVTFSSIPAIAADAQASMDNATGKRVDNGRIDNLPIPSPAELQLDLTYTLPSGVAREPAATQEHTQPVKAVTAPAPVATVPVGQATAAAMNMQAAVAAPPTRISRTSETLSEQGGGALFASGKAFLTDTAKQALDNLVARLKGKMNLRIAVVGHTDNEHLSIPTKRLFRDNQGLSEARALTVGNYLREHLDLPASRMATSGKGESQPVAINDTREGGMSRNRRVEITYWYDLPPVEISVAPPVAPPVVAPVPVAPVEPVVVAPPPPAPCSSVANTPVDLPFRVTVDGEPLALNEPTNEADHQRCTDVALAKGDIQIKYDDLAAKPALNVWTQPDTAVSGEKVEFRGYSNYVTWIRQAEVRIFRKGYKSDENPFAVLPLSWEKSTEWQVPVDGDDTYSYLLRVYDEKGRFDETGIKSLAVAAHRRMVGDEDKKSREALVGWGENALSLRNIPIKGGTVTVSGTQIKSDETVSTLGMQVPVDPDGRFVLRQILPGGPQTVEVKVSESDGKFTLFRRNLSIPDSDWFYIALGDLTVGRNHVVGPAELVTGDTQHYNNETYIDGRGAFYLKGKIKGEWLLTAAVDTGDQPLKDMFSNFSSKDPNYLLRNIDPNTYYPVYGDDSTTVDDAPTEGKFYVRLEKGDSHVMWGNFQTQWSGSSLIQYSRGLYGADARYRSEAATSFGEKRTAVDAFAADPGTVAARDEYRGTGGSLYFLQNQNITMGSERVWIEVRDKDSGLVIATQQLTSAQDYDIDYIQGRIMLRQTLSATGGAGGVVFTASVNGQPQYLVSTYEYVPGITAISGLTTGVHASEWVNDKFKIGVTDYHQGESGADQTLKGVDVTARVAAGTTFKAEVAHSTGAGDGAGTSIDGGLSFNGLTTGATDANARRVEANVDLADVTAGQKGKLSTYWQDKDRGFSGPGQIEVNGEAVRQEGFNATLPVGTRDEVTIKADVRDADSQDTNNIEVGLKHSLTDQWALTLGARHDDMTTLIANASPILSEDGARTDVVMRADYQPLKTGGKPGEKEDWSMYGFTQGTVSHTESREDNNRVGGGSTWRLNDRVKANVEVSDGNLGVGGKAGVDYRLTDRSNFYTSYVVESETPDTTYQGKQGTWVGGSQYQLNDQTRLFGELRASSGAGPQSLTQAFGVDLSPNDRWNYGSKIEFGTVSDPLAGDLKRTGLVFSTGYKFEKTKYTGSVEFRKEDSTANGHDDVWLLKNTYGRQYSAAWRLIGKFNLSHSSNSMGSFVDGDFHELVLGAAYRPVDNDRWNTLFKYTNYYNEPSPGQVATSTTANDYSQKSQVLDVDTVWDAKPWLSLGFKYGFRIGELMDNSTPGSPWFASHANLVVLRADWHLVKEWDGVAELRDLKALEADDARAGALLAVYRHMGNNMKFGAGYNFTNYTDNLTDLSYRSHGWFLNGVAKY